MSYHIEEINLADNNQLLPELVTCWRASVEATHDFLTPSDIERIASYVPDAIKSVTHLAIYCNDDGEIAGFIGIEGIVVEMLFLDPSFRGQGIGTHLLNYANAKYNANVLDVNEQNQQAVGFYLRYGFEIIGRSETDGMGDPFPILHMRLPDNHCA